MNTPRRKNLAEIHGQIEDLRDQVEEMRNDEIGDLNTLGEEFQKTKDGTRMSNTVRSLADLYQSLDEAVGAASSCY